MRLLCAVLILSLSVAFAESSVASTPKARCWNKPTSQTQMDGCAYLWWSRTKSRLNAALKIESKSFGKIFVNKSQANWTAFRNAECRLQASAYLGGSVYPLIYYTCEGTLTDLRTAQVTADVANHPH